VYKRQIKFITDSEQIKHPEKCFLVSDNEDRVIFVFTSNVAIRQKLHDIFIREGNEVQIISKPQTQVASSYSELPEAPYTSPTEPDPEICKPVSQEEKPDPIPILTPDIIEMMNVKSVSLFADPDFKSLISVFMRKPELFSVVAKYVQSGNVIEESLLPVKTPDMLSDEEITTYKKLCQDIKNLGIVLTDEIIMNRLIKYSGHLNLTVRSLLCESSLESNA
jgi:hypothetical protein